MNSVHPLSFVAVAPDIIIPMILLVLQEKNLRVWLCLKINRGILFMLFESVSHFATHLSNPFHAATSTPALSYVLLLVSPQCMNMERQREVCPPRSAKNKLLEVEISVFLHYICSLLISQDIPTFLLWGLFVGISKQILKQM